MLSAAGVSQPSDAAPLVLGGALAAQLLCDFGASALIELLLKGASLREQLREAWVYAVDVALTPIGLVVAWDMGPAPFAALALVPLLGVLATFGRERRRRVAGLVELNNAYRGTALVLGDVVEADDGYTGEHCRNVVTLALDVGDRLGLDAEQLRNLEFGALLHDVGKVAIPKEIINKTGPLGPREWEIVKTHAVEGQRMLDRVGGFMSEVGQIVRSHHERWDGGGYPDGLTGKQIPLESRIITACDSWNAMTTNRSYRAALPFTTAKAELLDSAGSQFDPRITVELLAAVVASGQALEGPAHAAATAVAEAHA